MSKPFLIAKNKKAYFNYEILSTIEAGIVLKGPEIKSIREHNLSLTEAFILIRNHEIFIYNFFIKRYPFTTHVKDLEETRTRKLLLHAAEINRLEKNVKQERLNLIPLKLYLKNNRAKIEIGVGRAKKNYDKREVIKKREQARHLQKYKD